MKLSRKMLKAGWVITAKDDGSYEITGSENQQYRYSPASSEWSRPLEEIEESLETDIQRIREGSLSPIITASRLTALPHFKNSSQPAQMICRNKWADGKTVLHLGTGREVNARAELLKSGCIEVEDYDPNFYPDKGVLDKQYDVIIATYLLNILPPHERRPVYKIIRDNLKDDGTAYITVQGVWPVENKYKIIATYQDGYLMQSGFNKTFRKGYTSDAFLEEIKNEIGGKPELIKMFYSNSFAKWTKS